MLTDEQINVLWSIAQGYPQPIRAFARAVEREAAARIRELEADLASVTAERDKARRDALEEMRNECLSAQDWTDGSLGWNRACARMEAACRMLIAKEPRT